MTVSGWLFDAYPSKDKMVIWIKTKSGKAIRLEDDWSHSIYAAANSKDNLQSVLTNKHVCQFVKKASFVNRHERITDYKTSEVLRLTLTDSKKAVTLGSDIEELFGDAVR